MTIEQKARAYDEAFEKARELSSRCIDNRDRRTKIYRVEDIESIFPQLKKSEDDKKTKESLMQYIWDMYHKDFYPPRPSIECCDKWLAWIEKQGEQKSVIEMKTPEESLGIDSKTYSEIVNECIYGEQKPTDKVEPKFKVGDKIRIKTPSSCDKDMQVARIEKDYYICNHIGQFSSEVVPFSKESSYELIEQNPANKVEPKFKIEKGKWYVCIRDLLDNYANKAFYKGDTYLSTQDGSLIPCNSNVPFEVVCTDTYFREWTIQDARDGDVLAINWHEGDNYWEKIIIFKKYHNKGVKGLYSMPCVEGYGNTFKNGKLVFNEEVPYYSKTWTSNLQPATKKQRATLEKAMADAGWEFDFEKKELKKIEQMHIECNDADELSCFESALFTAFSYAWQSYLMGEEVDVKQWTKEQSKELLEAAKEELKGNNTAEWSEEDEKIYQSIMDDTVQENQLDVKQTDWLRSIRYRYFPRPQNTWKPSEEQIEVLQDTIKAYNEVAFPTEVRVLSSLCNELKKL